MQVIFEDENEVGDSERTSSMSPLIHIGRISRCMEGEHDRGIEDRRDGV